MQSHRPQFKSISSKPISSDWEEISPVNAGKKRKNSSDSITLRIKSNKSESYSLSFSIGRDILDLLNWKTGDRVKILRRPTVPYLLKMINDSEGLKLYNNGYTEESYPILNCKITANLNGNILTDKTEELAYEIQSDHLIIDISNMFK